MESLSDLWPSVWPVVLWWAEFTQVSRSVLCGDSCSDAPPSSILNDITWVDTAGETVSSCITKRAGQSRHHLFSIYNPDPRHQASSLPPERPSITGRRGASCWPHPSLLAVSQERRGRPETERSQDQTQQQRLQNKSLKHLIHLTWIFCGLILKDFLNS